MHLGYKFYRDSFIMAALLSIGCAGVFWDHLRGRGNPDDQPGALVLIAVLMVFGNVGLFVAMRRAKRREQAAITRGSSSDETPAA